MSKHLARSIRAAVGVAAVLPFVSGGLGAQAVGRAELTKFVDSLVAAQMDGGKKAAGMTIGVVKGSDTLLLKPYGYADLEFDVPTPDRAIYEIGSVTKQFTAAAILQLRDAGKLSLDDEITKYFPGYPTQGNRITVRQLLDHTSGIKGYTEIPEFRTLMLMEAPKDTLVKLFQDKPFDFPTGTAQIYNNSAFFLAGLIIEKLSGMTYADYVRKNFFEKVGMADSRYCDEREIQKRRAHGYDMGPKGLVVKGYLDQTWPYSAGSLCSTVGDLIAWNRALHGGKVLPAASYKDLITPASLTDGTKLRYGMGIALTDVAGHRAIHHGGGINGYLSESTYFPDDDAIIVVLINTAGPVSPDEIRTQIAKKLLGDVPVKAVALDHPLSDYVGEYRGAARGSEMVMKVSEEGGKLVMARKGAGNGPQAEPRKPQYIGSDRFEDDGTWAIFVREAGKVTKLRLDQGYGHSVLVRDAKTAGK